MLYAYGRWFLEGWYEDVEEDVYVPVLKTTVRMKQMKLKADAPPDIVESYEHDMATIERLYEEMKYG